MRIVTLCENRLEPCFGLKASHGLSLYIEYEGHKILYDLGQDDVYIKNAKLLNIDLSQCDNVIISHGHLDHAGGLMYLDSLEDKVIIDKTAFLERKRVIGNEKRDIGVSNVLSKYRDLGSDIDKAFELHKGVWCVPRVQLPSDYKSMEKGLFVIDEMGNMKDDTFQDEISLALESTDGLYIVSGCSHRGTINIIKECMKVTKQDKVHTFIGGLHLNFAPKEEIEKVLYLLKELDVKRFVVGHCTGWRAISMMEEILGSSVEIIYNYTGYEFN